MRFSVSYVRLPNLSRLLSLCGNLQHLRALTPRWATLALVLVVLLALGCEIFPTLPLAAAAQPQRAAPRSTTTWRSAHPLSRARGWIDCSVATCFVALFGSPPILHLLFVSLLGCLTRGMIEHARRCGNCGALPLAPCPPLTQARHRPDPPVSLTNGGDAGRALRGLAQVIPPRRNTIENPPRRRAYLRELSTLVIPISHWLGGPCGSRVAAAAFRLRRANVVVIAARSRFCQAIARAFRPRSGPGNTVDGYSLQSRFACASMTCAPTILPSGGRLPVRFAAHIDSSRRDRTTTTNTRDLVSLLPLTVCGGPTTRLAGSGGYAVFTCRATARRDVPA